MIAKEIQKHLWDGLWVVHLTVSYILLTFSHTYLTFLHTYLTYPVCTCHLPIGKQLRLRQASTDVQAGLILCCLLYKFWVFLCLCEFWRIYKVKTFATLGIRCSCLNLHWLQFIAQDFFFFIISPWKPVVGILELLLHGDTKVYPQYTF